ncbi:MAG: FtsX-like permease family protein [Chlorobi bacterium]|nr:FtsX-like permease family protein [Chlorobiota bacterium]
MIKQTVKNMRRSPMLLFINLPGLAIGLSAFLLLMVYVWHETAYDKHFTTKNRVLRLYNTIKEGNSINNYPICSRKAYTQIPNEIPEIEKACQIYRGWQNKAYYEGNAFSINKLIYVDPEFFDVFGLDLSVGNKADALKGENKIVLSKSLATRIFGTNNGLGRMLKMGSEDYVVGGIIEDLPKTTHFRFDALVSMESINPALYMGSLEFFTYYLIGENSDRKALQEKISKLNDKYLMDIFSSNSAVVSSGTEPLDQLHLYTKCDFDLSPKGSIDKILLVAGLAAFILLIAIINFVNLYVYDGEKRLLEIGMRKSFGAGLFDLRLMFYLETTFVCLIAFGLAFLLAMSGLPYFSNMMMADLSIDDFMSGSMIAALAVFFVLLVFIAGSYPAVYLSRLRAVDAIKGGAKTLKRKKWLAVSSVMIQFFISISLIVSLLVLNAQITCLKNIPLGFNVEKVIGINNFDKALGDEAQAIKQELKKQNFVEAVGSSTHYMGGGVSGQGVYLSGQSEEDSRSINQYRVQPGFCQVMQLQLVDGRFFSDSDEDKHGIILNESAVKMLELENPVGKSLIMFEEQALKIIGVVRDFYYNENSGKLIQPLCLTNYSPWANNFYLRIKGEYTAEKRLAIKKIFEGFMPAYHFTDFALKQRFDAKFAQEERYFNMVLLSTILAIFLSFIGMFALSVYNVEKRTKEIGLRKVLGSSSFEVMTKLLTDILAWVVWAMLPAFAAAYIVSAQFLDNFANKTELSPWYFIFGGLIALLVAASAISIKSISAANRNPVDSLRDE